MADRCYGGLVGSGASEMLIKGFMCWKGSIHVDGGTGHFAPPAAWLAPRQWVFWHAVECKRAEGACTGPSQPAPRAAAPAARAGGGGWKLTDACREASTAHAEWSRSAAHAG